MTYIINLFGEGLRVWNCQMTILEYNRINKFRLKNNLNWESIFFDLHILNKLGYDNWTAFSIKESSGLTINTKNKIEIKCRSKKILKINSDKILNKESLFDLYNTKTTKVEIAYKLGYINFILVSFELGLIGKYTIDSNSFSIDKLIFETVKNNQLNQSYLANIVYGKELIIKAKNDSVARGFRVVI